MAAPSLTSHSSFHSASSGVDGPVAKHGSSGRFVNAAVVQMTSIGDKAANIAVCADLVVEAAASGVQLLCFPENFAFMGESSAQSLSTAETVSGPTVSRFRELAKLHRIWLSLGGLQTVGADEQHLRNTHVLISDSGELVTSYDKIHLFDVAISPAQTYLESSFTTPGEKAVVADTPLGKIGLTTCYDIRFPELYTALAMAGAHLILVPSAFTVPTGMAHWEVLLRARAIETQSYVLAAAQIGTHNSKRQTYGYAMIVDPWGTIVAQCSTATSPGFASAKLDLDFVASVRAKMPISTHRRPAAVSNLVVVSGAPPSPPRESESKAE